MRDDYKIILGAGLKGRIKRACEKMCFSSMANYIRQAIREKLDRDGIE